MLQQLQNFASRIVLSLNELKGIEKMKNVLITACYHVHSESKRFPTVLLNYGAFTK